MAGLLNNGPRERYSSRLVDLAALDDHDTQFTAGQNSMATITIQVLEGFEAGRLYCDLSTPISIGREEDNDIRLNDDRVSRFHAKVQEDAGRIILTDLDSTNGTRVNGHPVRMRVLQLGDQILFGRCLMVFGSPEELANLHAPAKRLSDSGVSIAPPDDDEGTHLPYPEETAPPKDPFGGNRPELPEGLTPLQAVQVSDLLSFVRASVLYVLESGEEQKPVPLKGSTRMTVPPDAWHLLQKLQLDLSQFLREISEP